LASLLHASASALIAAIVNGHAKEIIMSTTTIDVDDTLIEKARSYVGSVDNAKLAEIAFRTLIQRKAGQWLAAQGGTQPDIPDVPRRRWGTE
jgi:hypothetical protein